MNLIQRWALDPETKFPLHEKIFITQISPIMRMIVALLNPYYENEPDAPAANEFRLKLLKVTNTKQYIDQLMEDIITAAKANPGLINQTSSNGYTPFLLLVRCLTYWRSRKLIKIFCKLGAAVNTKTDLLITPLHMACNKKSYFALNVVKRLIKYGADINTQDNFGITPLMYAIRRSSLGINIIGLLLDAGADLEIKDKYGKTALIIACKENNDQLVRLLIKSGAGVNAVTNTGESALIIASIYSGSKSSEKIVKMLIKAGANINHANHNNQTALILAAMNTNIHSSDHTIKILLKAGASINIGYKIVISVVVWIGKSAKLSTLKILLDAGADVNVQVSHGNTALILAVIGRQSETVQVLLDASPNLNIINNEGLNVFDIMQILITPKNIVKMICDYKRFVEYKAAIQKNIYRTYLIKIPEQAGKVKFDVGNFGYELAEISFRIKTGQFCYQTMDKPYLIDYLDAKSEDDFIGKVRNYFLEY